ncbi:MAG TPA: TonB-dependent receptor, partial [Leptospiraceae bacterium]|nr:TonB-dependent receptor [Leptospiraceae bacterium]
ATGEMIDAVNIEDEWEGSGENLKLPKEETSESDDKVLDKFGKKAGLRIRVNSSRKVNNENIDQYLTNHPLSKSAIFPITKDDKAQASQEVFKLLEDIEVVTATKTKTKIKDAPAAVYVITADQIRERGYKILSEALQDVPGFDFQHTYGIYPQLVHQRGLVGENNRTLVYVDGIADNNINEFGAIAGTIQFPLQNVERIEIVSGPSSSLYGANAFNGVINIITKDGKTSPGNQATAMYGGWEKSGQANKGYSMTLTSRGSVATLGGDHIQYSASGYFYKTEGPNFGGIGQQDKKGYNPNDVSYGLERKFCGGQCSPDSKSVGYYWSPTYNNSQVETYNATAKFSYKGFRFETINWQYLQGEGTFANGTQQIDTKQRGFETKNALEARNLARLYGVALGNASLKGFSGSHWDFRNNTVNAGYNHKIKEGLTLDTEATIRNTQVLSSSGEEYPNKNGWDAFYRPGDTSQGTNYSRPDTSYQSETKLFYEPTSKVSTILGASAIHYVAAKDYGSAERYTFNNFSGFAQAQYRPIDKIAFTAGYRYDEFSTFGKASSPRISMIISPTKNFTIKLLAGTGFRAPTVKEMFSETKQRKPNGSLRPELLKTYEVGLGYNFMGKLYTSLHGYYNKVTNLILEVTTLDSGLRNGAAPSGGFWQQNQNLGEARIYGAEWDNAWTMTDKLKLNLSYNYVDGKYMKLPSSLPTSPSTAGRIGDNWKDDFRTAVYKQFTGTAAIPEEGKIPNIAPHKAFIGFTWKIVKDLSLFTAVNMIDIRRTKATNPEKTTPGYKMFKMNLHWDNAFTQGMFLNLQVNNLGNEQFFDPGIRAAAGTYYPTRHPLEHRNVWLTVGYNF